MERHFEDGPGTLSECLIRQEEETVALQSIYPDLISTYSNNRLDLCIASHQDKTKKVTLEVTLLPEYPLRDPPLFQISAPWMTSEEKLVLSNLLIDSYLNNYQEPVLFNWIDIIKDSLDPPGASEEESFVIPVTQIPTSITPSEDFSSVVDRIVSSEVSVDRKSYFQGHCCTVHSMEEVHLVIRCLKSYPKISKATHNVVAYRFKTPEGHLNSDHDDDGEHAAGARLSHLLHLCQVENVVVMVSRWFGGILLGPDRFKHINQAAKAALVKAEFVNSS